MKVKKRQKKKQNILIVLFHEALGQLTRGSPSGKDNDDHTATSCFRLLQQ